MRPQSAEDGVLTLARTLPGAQLSEVVRLLITLMPPKERSMLRPWILARYDVSGNPNRRADGKSTDEAQP